MQCARLVLDPWVSSVSNDADAVRITIDLTPRIVNAPNVRRFDGVPVWDEPRRGLTWAEREQLVALLTKLLEH